MTNTEKIEQAYELMLSQKEWPSTLSQSFNKHLIVSKEWGKEIIIENNITSNRCAKILSYEKNGSISSYHYHIKKVETFYVVNGLFILRLKDLKTGKDYFSQFCPGDTIELKTRQPHQLLCETAGNIFETSSHHSDEDVYRIEEGDSQKEGEKKK